MNIEKRQSIKGSERVAELVFMLNVRLREAFDKKRHEDLSTMLQTRVLYFIDGKSPSMKDLADYFCITPPSVTNVVNRLIKAGYVTRTHSLEDRRSITLKLTSKGKKEVERKMNEVEKAMMEVIGKLTSNEKKVFVELLKKII